MARMVRPYDEFTAGYLECMIFTECNPDNDEELDGKGIDDLAPETLAEIIAECEAFQAQGATSLALAYDYAPINYDASSAGQDFWLTRNHHGAGFWDRGFDGPCLDATAALTTAAHRWGQRSLYLGDDGKLYLYA